MAELHITKQEGHARLSMPEKRDNYHGTKTGPEPGLAQPKVRLNL